MAARSCVYPSLLWADAVFAEHLHLTGGQRCPPFCVRICGRAALSYQRYRGQLLLSVPEKDRGVAILNHVCTCSGLFVRGVIDLATANSGVDRGCQVQSPMAAFLPLDGQPVAVPEDPELLDVSALTIVTKVTNQGLEPDHVELLRLR